MYKAYAYFIWFFAYFSSTKATNLYNKLDTNFESSEHIEQHNEESQWQLLDVVRPFIHSQKIAHSQTEQFNPNQMEGIVQQFPQHNEVVQFFHQHNKVAQLRNQHPHLTSDQANSQSNEVAYHNQHQQIAQLFQHHSSSEVAQLFPKQHDEVAQSFHNCQSQSFSQHTLLQPADLLVDWTKYLDDEPIHLDIAQLVDNPQLSNVGGQHLSEIEDTQQQNKLPSVTFLDDGQQMQEGGNLVFENSHNHLNDSEVSSSSAQNQRIQVRILLSQEQKRNIMQQYYEIKAEDANLKDKDIAKMLKIKPPHLSKLKKEFPGPIRVPNNIRIFHNKEQKRNIMQQYYEIKVEDINLKDKDIAKMLKIKPPLLSIWKKEFPGPIGVQNTRMFKRRYFTTKEKRAKMIQKYFEIKAEDPSLKDYQIAEKMNIKQNLLCIWKAEHNALKDINNEQGLKVSNQFLSKNAKKDTSSNENNSTS